MQVRAVLGLIVGACGGTASRPSTPPQPLETTSSARCTNKPRAIASGQDAPGLVVVDDTTAYWTNQNGGQVMSAPLDGGTPQTLAEHQHPFGITIDATHVYWANNLSSRTGSVMRVAKQGGTPQVVAGAQGTPYGPVIAGNVLYWVNAEDGTIVRAALDGKNRKVLASGQIGPTAIATDGRSVFWIHTKAGAEIRKVSIDGGTPITLANVVGNPQTLAVDRGRVYWTNGHRGTVEAVSVDGGATTDVVIDEHYPIHFVLDDANIYWIDHDRPDVRPPPPKRIRKAPIAGGDAVTLASGNDAVGITVDAHCVYWTEARGTTGQVMTVAK